MYELPLGTDELERDPFVGERANGEGGGLMRLFLYQERTSFLHRLNPLTKLAVNLPMWVVLSMVTDPVTALMCHGCAMTAEEGARRRGCAPSDLLFLSRDGGT